MYLDKAKMKEEALHQVGFEDLVPCTEDEIAFLERWIKRPLPQAYREFLQWMGYWGGGLFVGSDFFYDRLMNMQEGARALLEEDHYPGELPEDAFVFFMHQGYQFYFFRFSEGADPPVYYYLEDPEKPEQSTENAISLCRGTQCRHRAPRISGKRINSTTRSCRMRSYPNWVRDLGRPSTSK